MSAEYRAALAADAAEYRPGGFPDSRIAALASGDSRDSVARWVHGELLDRHRAHYLDPAVGLLRSANAVLAREPLDWSPETLHHALTRTRFVLTRQPAVDGPLALPLAAARPGVAVDLWRWFADRYDVVANQETRRAIDRLLPSRPDDPHWALTYDCPLADRLRVALRPWLTHPGVVALLRHCEEHPVPVDMHSWFDDLCPLVARDADDPTVPAVLLTVAETVRTHRSVPYPLHRHGRRAVRLVWAEPATRWLVRGALHAMVTLPHDWVDELLPALAVQQARETPVGRGPTQPLWWYVTAALRYRRTSAGRDQLRRLRADGYPR